MYRIDIGHCSMASFYYDNQNPPGYYFLVQINAFVTYTPVTGTTKFKDDRKNELILSSKETSSCKWPIVPYFDQVAVHEFDH